jgi:hypothetical protein
LVIGFPGMLKLVTTINYSVIANSHTLQFITARTKISQSAVSSPVFAWQWLQRRTFISFHGSCPRWLAPISRLTRGRNPWPLTYSRVWPALATTRSRWLVLTEDCL